jgi:hypothetical protein
MSRSRALTVAAGAAYAALAATIASRDMAATSRMIENRGQAMPKGAQRAIRDSREDRKASKRAAAAELVRISNQTLVVSHLHPRWLRECVSDMMAAGANIDMASVDMLRDAGPEGARMIVGAYRG